jgi:hypothetical protein
MSVNITRARGDTYPLVFTIKSNGVPLDISGVLTMLLTVDPKKAPVDDVNNLFTLAGDVIDGPAGVVSFPISESQADHVGNYFYDVQMVDGASVIRTIQNGKFSFVQDITKGTGLG